MPSRFPPPLAHEEHATLHPHAEMGTAPTKPTAGGRRLPRTLLLPAGVVLIAAGALLVWMVSGTVAGLGTDTIGAIAIALGVLVLVATRRSQRRHGSADR